MEDGGFFSAALYPLLNKVPGIQIAAGAWVDTLSWTRSARAALLGAVALGAMTLGAVAAAASTAATAWCDPFLQLLQLETDMFHVLSPPFFRKVGVGKCSRGLCDAYSEVPEMKIGWVRGHAPSSPSPLDSQRLVGGCQAR